VTDLGPWRFIGVNTAGGLFTEKNALWLRQQIKNDAIIYLYIPPHLPGWIFHSLFPDSTFRFFKVLNEFQEQVRACFFGHIHSFDCKYYNGIPLFLIDAGGAAALGLGVDGYEGTRPFQAMAFDTASGEIHVLKDKNERSLGLDIK